MASLETPACITGRTSSGSRLPWSSVVLLSRPSVARQFFVDSRRGVVVQDLLWQDIASEGGRHDRGAAGVAPDPSKSAKAVAFLSGAKRSTTDGIVSILTV